MKVKTMIAVATVLSMIEAAGTVAAQQAVNQDQANLVKAVMDDTYGQDYDAKNACWAYTWRNDQGEPADYCMRPGTPQIIKTHDGQTLYLNTYSATDIRGDAKYGYTQVRPGLMGAFKIKVGGKQGWTYEALDGAIDYGSAGDCGCAKARLVKLSNAGDYGWMFTSGGTWQGVTVSDYSIVTAVKGRMKDVSKIPQSAEKAPGVSYSASVKEDPSAKGFYPLHVVKTTAGSKTDEFDIAFDPAKSIYALPAGR